MYHLTVTVDTIIVTQQEFIMINNLVIKYLKSGLLRSPAYQKIIDHV